MLLFRKTAVIATLMVLVSACFAADQEEVVVRLVGRMRIPLTKVDLAYSTKDKLNFFRISAETDILSKELRSFVFTIGDRSYPMDEDALSQIKYPRLKDILFTQNFSDVASADWRSEVILYFNGVEDYIGDELDSSFADISLTTDGIQEIFIYNSITDQELILVPERGNAGK